MSQRGEETTRTAKLFNIAISNDGQPKAFVVLASCISQAIFRVEEEFPCAEIVRIEPYKAPLLVAGEVIMK